MRKTALFTLCVLMAALTANTAPTDTMTYTLPNNQTIQRFLPESDNTGWAVQVGGQLLYFADGTFTPLSGTPPEGSNFYETIVGDASRGFYQQRYIYIEDSYYIKLLYRLIDGKAQLHCKPIQVTNAVDYVNGCYTYLAKEGRVVSWNDGKFLLWLNDAWHRLPIDNSHSKTPPLFFDNAGFIIIFMEKMFYIINPDGEIKELSIKADISIVNCQAWDMNTIIALNAKNSSLIAFDIRTGAKKSLPYEFNSISDSIKDMQRSPNDILWCFTDKSIYRLSPGRATSKIERPGCDVMEVLAIADTKDLSKSLKDDTQWNIFYLNENNELRNLNSQLVIDCTSSMNIFNKPRSVIANANRKVWILTGTAANRLIDIDLNGRREQSRLNETELWQIYKIRQNTPLLENNGHIAFFSETENSLLRWNGKDFTTTKLPDIIKNHISDTAIDSRGIIYCIVFISNGFNNERLYEIIHNRVKLISDDRSDRSFHVMESAISRSTANGATSFNWRGGDVLITSDRDAWVQTKDSEVLKYYSGGAWKFLRLAKAPNKIIETKDKKVAIHLQNEGWFVYNAGLFDQGISIPSSECRKDTQILYDKTPLKNRIIEAQHSDMKGNIWLWLKEENRVARCQTDKVKIMLSISPSSPDNIMLEATTSYALGGIRFAYRLSSESDWIPFNTPASNRARIFFPASGIYKGEVAAFYLGEKIPDTAAFTFTAQVIDPETLLTEDLDNKQPLLIKSTLWHPPVKASSSTYVRAQSCKIVWRISGEKEWNKLEDDGTFPLYRLLTNGTHSIDFATEEAEFLSDKSPLTLCLNLSLDDVDLLRLTLKNLLSEDVPDKTTAKAILENNRARWEHLLPIIKKSALEAKNTLDVLSSVERFLPHELEAQ